MSAMSSSHSNSDHYRHHNYRSRNKDNTYDYYPKRKRKHSSFSPTRPSYSRDYHKRYGDYREDFRSPQQADSRESSTDLNRFIKRKVDQEKLLFIARKNLVKMIKNSELPSHIPIDQIQLPPEWLEESENQSTNPKTLQEYTKICKTVSKVDKSERDNFHWSKHEIHHPFEVKERKGIQFNVPEFNPVKCRSAKEVQKDLLQQFPVSSGSVHRNLEWQAVIPPTPTSKYRKDGDSRKNNKIFSDMEESNEGNPDLDSGMLLSQRLHAMRKLSEDAYSTAALVQQNRGEDMNGWVPPDLCLGQFTGSTGANILSPAELEPKYPAWTKKDQFQKADKIKGGVGMHLLQKMGWTPGEALGRRKKGSLEPVIPMIKFDTKGLAAEDEKVRKVYQKLISLPDVFGGKNPISLLYEYCARKKLDVPVYDLAMESGPPHRPDFIMKVTVNNVEYKPTVPTTNKKEAKALAAAVCLKALNLLTEPASLDYLIS